MILMKTRVEGDIYPGGPEFLVQGLCPATNSLYYLWQLLNPFNFSVSSIKQKNNTAITNNNKKHNIYD